MTTIESLFTATKNLVIVERCPAPPAKPPTVIYEKYLPQPLRPRQVIVQREQCVQPAAVATCAPSCVPTRRLVKEIIRHVPQPAPAVVCRTEQQQQISPGQSHAVEQLVPVFATRQVSSVERGKKRERETLFCSPDFFFSMSFNRKVFASFGK